MYVCIYTYIEASSDSRTGEENINKECSLRDAGFLLVAGYLIVYGIYPPRVYLISPHYTDLAIYVYDIHIYIRIRVCDPWRFRVNL